MNQLIKSLFPLLLLAILAACSSDGPTKLKGDLGISGAPDWVNEGTSTINNKDGRLFHGVGQASPMGDPALQKSTADDRARAEVARILSSYLDVVSNDYMAAARSDSTAVSEESVSRQIKNLSKVNLAGARIIRNWRDPNTNIIYSIAELDVKQIKMSLNAVQDMNADLKLYVTANADNIFDRIAKDIARGNK
jgi:predicted small lipoprotein YifL